MKIPKSKFRGINNFLDKCFSKHFTFANRSVKKIEEGGIKTHFCQCFGVKKRLRCSHEKIKDSKIKDYRDHNFLPPNRKSLLGKRSGNQEKYFVKYVFVTQRVFCDRVIK